MTNAEKEVRQRVIRGLSAAERWLRSVRRYIGRPLTPVPVTVTLQMDGKNLARMLVPDLRTLYQKKRKPRRYQMRKNWRNQR